MNILCKKVCLVAFFYTIRSLLYIANTGQKNSIIGEKKIKRKSIDVACIMYVHGKKKVYRQKIWEDSIEVTRKIIMHWQAKSKWFIILPALHGKD